MIKTAIIGCGVIADAHAEQIQRIPSCEIVGVCDKEELMARQLYDRFEVKHYFSDVNKLLEEARPHIVHITTPPQSHFELGRLCLEAGCNVYMEKPFTLNTSEAEHLIELASKTNLKITAGHNLQFSHEAMRMRELINNGFLGGDPVHMESIYCYDLGDERYAKVLLGDKTHWVRKLPGKLLHNVISHGVSRIAEFLKTDYPKVVAHGFTSPFLKSIGETEIIDELRVIISDNASTTAYFTFSSQISPGQNYFRICGSENSLIVDHVNRTLIQANNKGYKSYMKYFVTPLSYGSQYLQNSVHNIAQFLRRDFHDDSGMKLLIASFYHSVLDDTPLPIPYKDIIVTSRIMDAIFEQIYS
ncbi:MAG: Gfo/Idh/MocA family protein [Desulfobacterales bacterium]